MIETPKNIKDKVEFLLKNYPSTRDDDKKLWLAYLNLFCDLTDRMNKAKIPSDVFKHVLMDAETPSTETIRRVRQKFQEEGFYVGNKREKLLKARQKAQKKTK
jgi:uncharacterized protein YcgL (UPF0745 family)